MISAWNDCYIFAYFSQTPTSISNLTISLEGQWIDISNDVLSELNTFLFLKICQSNQWQWKNSKTSPSLRAYGPPSNTAIPWPTPLTTANGIRIQSAVLPQFTLQTDSRTDIWDRRQFCTKSAYDSEHHANNTRLRHRLNLLPSRNFIRALYSIQQKCICAYHSVPMYVLNGIVRSLFY